MNYPIWEVPSAGLLIAVVAVVHVFVSHFAVGGGLFLVLAEIKARRENDAALLDWLVRHSRFFILVTLVFGAMTGVGIWFTIALVSPAATSTLINTFVWGWAMEWTFFVAEIAAAMIYYYGWSRLDPRTHLVVGWLYFAAAWASLAIINGILSFMMTPGGWVTNRGFWSGFFNPTYLPSLVMRTAVAVGLAGIYALITAAWSRDRTLRGKVGRWAATRWILPAAVVVPATLAWYLVAAERAAVPAAEILGTRGGVGAVIAAVFTGGTPSGYPVAKIAAVVALVASALVIVIVGLGAVRHTASFGKSAALAIAGLALVAMGAGEWLREDLRKPYVIGRHMFVNGVRLPRPPGAPPPPAGTVDAFTVPALERDGVLASARFARVPAGWDAIDTVDDPAARADLEAAAGAELFRLSCSACHTVDGYHGIRPRVAGMNVTVLQKVVSDLARPVGPGGAPTSWDDPQLHLATWLGRRMPPFAGTDRERRALAIYLARLGGSPIAGVEVAAAGGAPDGARLFEDNCVICHEPGGDAPASKLARGRDAATMYVLLGRLPELNDAMPPFEGTDKERRALAAWLASVGATGVEGEERHDREDDDR